jgi:hypothetical protein
MVMCARCGTTVMLGGPLAVEASHGGQLPELAGRWLTTHVDARDSSIPFGPVGRVPTSDAARILGISKQETRALAAAELIPAVRDHRGYWYRADQITLVARARHARQPDLADLDRQHVLYRALPPLRLWRPTAGGAKIVRCACGNAAEIVTPGA